MSSSPSIATNTSANCLPVLNIIEYQYYTLIPAFVIFVVLHFYEFYLKRCCHVITPFLFLLDNDKNRGMTVLAFGATVSSIIQLIFSSDNQSIIKLDGVFGKSFAWILSVIVIALINYPIFACINSPYVFIASLLGGLFTLWKLILLLMSSYVTCPEGIDQVSTIVVNIILVLPDAICMLLLMIIFCKRVFCSLQMQVYERQLIDAVVVQKYQISYTKQVFQLRRDDEKINGMWYVRLFKRMRWNWVPWFQYSTEFSSAILIIFIVYFYFVILGIYGGFQAENLVQLLLESVNNTVSAYTMTKKIGVGFEISYSVSIIVTAITYTCLLTHLIYQHKKDLLAVYTGKKIDLHQSYQTMVRCNILFPGYLVAYMTWGMLAFFGVFLLLLFLLYTLVVVAIEMHVIGNVVVMVLKYVASIMLVPVITYIVQVVLVYFVFSEKLTSKISIRIKNIKVYHITIYFFFFFNILVGFMSCLLRSLKAFVVSLLFLGRIDRTSMVSNFFKSFDTGYLAYISFLNVQAAYKNPIMRCFCNILLQSSAEKVCDSDMHDGYSLLSNSTNHIRRPVQNMVAFNRWFLALTLTHNPALIPTRCKGENEIIPSDSANSVEHVSV